MNIQKQKEQIPQSTINKIIQQKQCLSKTINLIIHPKTRHDNQHALLLQVTLENIRYKAHHNAEYDKTFWHKYWRKKRDYPNSVKHYVQKRFKLGDFNPISTIDQIAYLDQRIKHIGCG